MGRAEAAPGPQRQVLAPPIRLRQQHGVLEPREVRRRHDPGGEARDLPRGREIPLELRGRDGQHLRVVVEPGVRRLVPGSSAARRSPAPGGRGRRCRTPYGSAGASSRCARDSGSRLPLRRCAPPASRHRARLVLRGPRASGRRHRARSEPRDHALPDVGVGARSFRVYRVQRQPRLSKLRTEHGCGAARRGDAALVVARDAVAIQEAADGVGRSERRLGRLGSQEVA